MKKIVYDISFNDMIKDITKNNSWYQGEEFADGIFIKMHEDIVTVCGFSDNWYGIKELNPLMITRGIVNMKFRQVYTQPDIMRKV